MQSLSIVLPHTRPHHYTLSLRTPLFFGAHTIMCETYDSLGVLRVHSFIILDNEFVLFVQGDIVKINLFVDGIKLNMHNGDVKTSYSPGKLNLLHLINKLLRTSPKRCFTV